jgi:hypothetical protein
MSGFTNDVMNAENVNFSGIDPTEGEITLNGQLMIGSTASPFIRPGFLTSTDGSIQVTNGAGSIDLSGTAQGFQPNAVLQEFDDFITWEASGDNAKLAWANTGSTVRSSNGTTANPGIVTNPSSAALSSSLYLNCDTNIATDLGPVVPGGGATTVNWIVKLGTLSGAGNTYRYSVGLADQDTIENSLDTYVSGVYFHYTDTVNSGNWQIKCTSASVTTTVNTSVAADTNFHTFTVSINAGATSVSFYIDNTIVGSAIVTNIPTAAMTAMYNAVKTAGTMPAYYADLFWIVINLSNPRPGPIAGDIAADYRWINNYTQTAISYQVLGTDVIIGVSNTAAPRTITMPNTGIVTGQRWTIKDESGGAAGNNITVNGNGYLIDGAATFPISTNYGSMDLYYNGSAFYIT